MKKLLPFFILFYVVDCSAQVKEQIYFFRTSDSLYGVKTSGGKIIIPAQKLIWWLEDDEIKQPITDELIFLQTMRSDKNKPYSIGMMYTRKGEELFTPLLFDNGPDWFSEGLMRFVKNGKVGFANRNGDIVIEAKFDFAGQFNYGVAWYCNGCVTKNKGEHSYVTGGYSGYVNTNGDTIAFFEKRVSVSDVRIDNKRYIPYPFAYSKKEQKIIDSFNRLPEISAVYFANYQNKFDSSEKKLRFEIVEKPSLFYPYYHIKAFQYSETGGMHGDDIMDLNFFADTAGRNFFVMNYNEKKVPLKLWLEEEIKEAKEYFKKHPFAPNKF